MFANSTEILAQISTIIREHPSVEKQLEAEFSLIQNVLKNSDRIFNENAQYILKKPELKRLEARLDKLEHNNDQLFCLIQFLFRKITSLSSQNVQPYNAEQPELKNDGHSKCKPELTKRELDVFNLLEKGLCAKEIAQVLFISETTVITHKKNLKEKFNARNTVELISKVLGR